ncbi:MAG: hypothetical protein JWM98_2086 [Thermoleophilia bacterium]|nr:hypothetical protein [Thermoleophilia bacterium]
MDDELRTLHEAMVVKDRLRMLAELQATYWEDLLARGFDGNFAEQLVLDWSRHAYGMTLRSMPEPSLDAGLDDLLGRDLPEPAAGAQPEAPRADSDPSRVPPGEPWLQLVQDLDLPSDAAEGDVDDHRAA